MYAVTFLQATFLYVIGSDCMFTFSNEGELSVHIKLASVDLNGQN